MPYGARDDRRPHRARLLAERLATRFCRLPPTVPAEVRDGDVLLIGPEADNHVALAVRGVLVEQTAKRLRLTPLARAWPFVTAVFRHPGAGPTLRPAAG